MSIEVLTVQGSEVQLATNSPRRSRGLRPGGISDLGSPHFGLQDMGDRIWDPHILDLHDIRNQLTNRLINQLTNQLINQLTISETIKRMN